MTPLASTLQSAVAISVKTKSCCGVRCIGTISAPLHMNNVSILKENCDSVLTAVDVSTRLFINTDRNPVVVAAGD